MPQLRMLIAGSLPGLRLYSVVGKVQCDGLLASSSRYYPRLQRCQELEQLRLRSPVSSLAV